MRSLPHAEIETYASPRLAAAKLADGHNNAAITDLVMPDLDGFGVLSRVLEARPCTPILLMTGKKDWSWPSGHLVRGRLILSRSRWTETG